MPLIDPTVALSTRQEAFCRHYAASGNAADAARQAGYAARSARQTGCALLERPYIVERLRRIRLSWKRTERDEARIVLARLEQAWDAAVASGSAYLMLRVLRFQAELSGLVRPAGANRAASGQCRRRTSSARWKPVGRRRPALNPARSPRPCAADATAPNAPSHATAKAGRRWNGRKASTGPRMRRPPGSSRKPSRSASACPSASSRPNPLHPKTCPPPTTRPEETYEDGLWASDEVRIDDDRADGAEHDWLYQRRNGFAEIYDPWAPENIEPRRQDGLEREGAYRPDGFDTGDPDGTDWPEDRDSVPAHDIS